jgi:isoprenylcysteine carboxyl methyltransferase (ICMT) family protein YpbQ
VKISNYDMCAIKIIGKFWEIHEMLIKTKNKNNHTLFKFSTPKSLSNKVSMQI